MPPDSENPSRVLSFTDHLEELRGRLIICIAFFMLAFSVSLWFAPKIVTFLIAPFRGWTLTEPQETLNLRLMEDGTIHFAGTFHEGKPADASPAVSPDAKSKHELTTGTLQTVARNKLRLELPFGQPPIIAGGTESADSKLFYLSPVEPFMLLLKAAALASATVTIPMVVYQFWLFIAPGLLRRERRIVKWLLSSSMLLFPTGAMFAYFITHFCIHFLMSFGDSIPGLTPNIVISKYVGFVMSLMIMFGLLFEFPIVLLLLARIGVIDSSFLVRRRRIAIVIMTAIAAFGVPSPDPFSMIALLIPLLFLYEASIWAIRLVEKADRAGALVKAR